MIDTPNIHDILHGWTVLVVDDEGDSLDVAFSLLEMAKAEVYLAANGQEGLQKAKAVRPDFILSDLSMPQMTGWEMLRELQSDIATREIPVIALTAHAMPGDRSRAMEVGFHNYISKPLMPAAFITNLLLLLDDIPELKARLAGQLVS